MVKKTWAQSEGSSHDDVVEFQNNCSRLFKGSEHLLVSGNRNTGPVTAVPPQFFVYHLDRCDNLYIVSNCRKFKSMSLSKPNHYVFKAKLHFNCFGNHLVKDSMERCNCRRCQINDVGK